MASEPKFFKTTSLGALSTVCEESRCPNQAECFAHGVATILVMGDVCTRHCLYCNIRHGRPLPLQNKEKYQVWQAIQKMKSSHIVLTTVSRDDLPDGGAQYLSEMAFFLKQKALLNAKQNFYLEFLLPDFQGHKQSWQTIAQSPIDVFSHNMELVPRLFTKYRPQGDIQISFNFLQFLAQEQQKNYVKSGFMVGLGETAQEVHDFIRRIRDTGTTILTIGQYLPPDKSFIAAQTVTHETFSQYEAWAKQEGFCLVFSGPFVRSSYLAHQIWEQRKLT